MLHPPPATLPWRSQGLYRGCLTLEHCVPTGSSVSWDPLGLVTGKFGPTLSGGESLPTAGPEGSPPHGPGIGRGHQLFPSLSGRGPIRIDTVPRISGARWGPYRVTTPGQPPPSPPRDSLRSTAPRARGPDPSPSMKIYHPLISVFFEHQYLFHEISFVSLMNF